MIKINSTEKTDISSFGETVREKRKEMRISQEDLAEKVGVSRNTISNIELGDETKLGVAVALACTLNLSMDKIFELTGERNMCADEFKLFHVFQKLSIEGKKQLLEMANVISKYDQHTF